MFQLQHPFDFVLLPPPKLTVFPTETFIPILIPQLSFDSS